MKEHFFAFIKPTEEEYQQIWSTCIFTFDTNILLNFYRYKSETTQTFFEFLDKLTDRIFITSQVGAEYFKNRLDVISEQEKAYSEVRESIKKHIEEPLQHQRKHPYISPELLEQLKGIAEKVKSELDERSKEYALRLSKDDILDKISSLFHKKVGVAFNDDKLNEIYEQGDKRYNSNIPPGFKDKNKGGTEQYGDLVLWFQIMELAKTHDKDVVFVTDDEKEDWLYRHKGRTISLLPELQVEFFKNTNRKIHIYTAQKFIEYAGELLQTSVKEETIDEVRILREENNLNTPLVERASDEPVIVNDDIDLYIDSNIEYAIRAVGDETGWADLAKLGLFLVRSTSLNYRNFGYISLSKFIESRKNFEVKLLQKSPNAKNVDVAYVRKRRDELD